MATTYNQENIAWYLERFAEYEKTLNGKSGGDLHRLKKSAIDKFASLGFPTIKDEDWKYTNLAQLSKIKYDPFVYPGSLPTQIPVLFEGLHARTFVFVNGRFDKNLSDMDALPKTIKIQPLASMSEKDVVSLITAEEDVFAVLNTAFFQDGIYIEISENYQVPQPLHVLNISVPANRHVLNHPRTIVKVGKHAGVKLIETYIGSDDRDYFTNPVSTFTIGEHAHFDHYRIQIDGNRANHVSTTRIDISRSGNVVSHAISLGSQLNRNDINVLLADENGECTLNGLYVGNQQQHIDNRTVIEHMKAHCLSTQIYKGVLDNKAHGVFNGKIHVYPDAQKTNAIQSNNCLLLSDDATINAKPQLEIYADDVRCTHGATVGQLDQDAQFYLQSRGIDEEKAKHMLIYAFAADVLTKMSLDAVKQYITGRFVEKLHTLKPE
jgi:Fe-S cluster assembly protein SufD